MYEAKIYFSTENDEAHIRRSLIITILDQLPHSGYVESATEGNDESTLHEGPIVYYCEDLPTARMIQSQLQERIHIPLKISIQEIHDSSWTSCWQDDYAFLETEKFHITDTASQPYSDLKGQVHLKIDGGGVFGKGDHATTEACLRVIETITPTSNARCLDVGTGTGILALAAQKLGFSSIGTDIDQDCLNIAEENAKSNDEVCSWLLGDLPHRDLSEFELLICNILIPELFSVLPSFIHRCTPDGTLLLAGFPEHRNTEVIEHLRNLKFKCTDHLTIRGWSCLRFQRI